MKNLVARVCVWMQPCMLVESRACTTFTAACLQNCNSNGPCELCVREISWLCQDPLVGKLICYAPGQGMVILVPDIATIIPKGANYGAESAFGRICHTDVDRVDLRFPCDFYAIPMDPYEDVQAIPGDPCRG